MRDNEIFKHYTKVGEMLEKMFPHSLEIVIHDLRRPNKSIVAIFNGHITGRKIGDATSDIGFKRLKGEIPDDLFNYKNESPSGDPLKSSSIAIRNSKGTLIGAFSLNMNIRYFEQFRHFLESFVTTEPLPFIEEKEKFHFKSPKEELKHIIQHIMIHRNFVGKSLSRKDKRDIIRSLWLDGHFNKRSAVTIVANELDLTRPTIYTYVKRFEKERSKKANEKA